jgi:excisionase family DNA binding protein
MSNPQPGGGLVPAKLAQSNVWPGGEQRQSEEKMAVYSKKQAAAYCGISAETLDRHKDQGKLGFTKIGKRVVFRQIELDKFLESLTIPAKAPPSLRERQIAANAARQHLREAVFQGDQGDGLEGSI